MKKIQLDNVPRAYEVADGSKAEVEGETRTPQGHFQFNNLLGTHGLDNTAFSISTLPTPKGLSHYNPNTFQFQQKMPSMSTIPRDVVNFDPIWPPQVQLNNIPESRYEENTSSENYC